MSLYIFVMSNEKGYTMTTHINEPLRISVCRDVLEAAKDAKDAFVIGACRRILTAYRLGKDKALTDDWRVVRAFADAE